MKCCRFVTLATLTAFALAFVAACGDGGAPVEKPNVKGFPGQVTWKCSDTKCKGDTMAVYNATKPPLCDVCKKETVKPEVDKYKCATEGCKKGEIIVKKGDKAPSC